MIQVLGSHVINRSERILVVRRWCEWSKFSSLPCTLVCSGGKDNRIIQLNKDVSSPRVVSTVCHVSLNFCLLDVEAESFALTGDFFLLPVKMQSALISLGC